MDFWDTPIQSTETTSTPVAGHQRQQSLNEEVTEVMGQLNKFWGGFRKQSQDALQAAKKDLGQYATQAQQYAAQAQKGIEKEFTKLGVVSEASSSDLAERNVSADGEEISTSNTDSIASSSSTLPGTSDEPHAPTSPISPTNLFSRLQASLPPDLIHTLQSNLPESIRHAPERLDLTQLRHTLQQVRLQDATARGEELLKSAGDFLRDAVRVVPPTDGDVGQGLSSSATSTKGKAPMRDGPIGTRKDALLRSLRANAAILKVDPIGDKNSEALFRAWEAKQVTPNEGGMLGDVWKERIQAELEDAGESLFVTAKELVPHEMTEETFWTRYFFRVFQIEQEEERRKALLAGSSQSDEDFSWEDEDEESSSPTDTLRDRAVPSTEQVVAAPSKANHLAPTTGTSSPSQSEGSYDIVSGHVSNASESAPAPHPSAKSSTDEGDDSEESDWE